MAVGENNFFFEEGKNEMEISGTVLSGAGKGAFFTQIDWVVEQCRKNLGYKPFPGTLNVRINDRDLARLSRLLEPSDFVLIPDDPTFCSAGVKRIMLNDTPAAVVIPGKEVRIHEDRILEVIASCSLKQKLNLTDGDIVCLSRPEASKTQGKLRISERKGEQPVQKMAVFKFAASAARSLKGFFYLKKERFNPVGSCENYVITKSPHASIPEANILFPLKLFR